MKRLSFLCLPLLLSAATGHAAGVWCDFESAALGSQWQVRGAVQVSRADVADAPAGPGGASGKMMLVKAGGRALIQSRAGAMPLPKVAGCEELEMWVRRMDAGAEPLAFDVMFLEADEKAAFWRKVEVAGAGWQKVTVPLRWFRWENGRVPRWPQAASFAIRTRGAGEFAVDGIAMNDREPGRGADYTMTELAELAFGAGKEGVRVKSDGPVWLATDEPSLDVDALSAHLGKVLAAMQADLPLGAEAAGSPRLMVFRSREDYRGFVPRFAAQFGAKAAEPGSDGYHLQGVALSSWKAEAGTLRPVFTHEFCHSVLSHHALTDSAHSDWWQEGVANAYQLRFHPQDGLAAIVRQGLADASHRSRFETLCAGEDVPLNRYWQVATLVQMLLAEPRYRGRLPALMEAFRKTGSTDLRPHIGPVLGCTWDQLTEDWMQWCAKTHGGGK